MGLFDTSDRWPRCARCQMPVEDFTIGSLLDSVVLTAYCHGDTEIVQVPDKIWDEFSPNDVVITEAFADP